MSDATQIAKLVANLGFTVNDTALNNFLTKLQTTITVLRELKQVATQSINFKVGINKTDLIDSKKMISTLGTVKVRIKDVGIGGMAMANARVQLIEGLGKAKIKINSASISKAALAQAHAREDVLDKAAEREKKKVEESSKALATARDSGISKGSKGYAILQKNVEDVSKEDLAYLKKREEMSRKAKEFSKPDAAKTIAEELLRIALEHE